MNALLKKAFDEVAKLPDAEQESIAHEVLALLDADREWDRLLESPESQRWLAEQSKLALAEYEAGETQEMDFSKEPE